MKSNRSPQKHASKMYQSSFTGGLDMSMRTNREEEEENHASKVIDEELVYTKAMTRDYASLTELEISMENITEIDPGNKTLRALCNLTTLSLAENFITEIKCLDTMRGLVNLNLRSNRITKIDNLNLPNLKELDLSHNKIEIITNLKQTKKLHTLNMSNNNIVTPSLSNGKAY